MRPRRAFSPAHSVGVSRQKAQSLASSRINLRTIDSVLRPVRSDPDIPLVERAEEDGASYATATEAPTECERHRVAPHIVLVDELTAWRYVRRSSGDHRADHHLRRRPACP
eukprot:CAMPEP_0113840276 /NCGR_PEP_ID=MMETSP0328-20130328/11535_1 /TAXON_ID=39455 /ORGANISM="Alexandrium minutum" /LENGTH=110 /DNA_ID=CAMNT_0000808963 /DNA_START=123 /DNA_END=452 /DNA_ORIENTATION=- /assembly_acc=CAM_ASM_000350